MSALPDDGIGTVEITYDLLDPDSATLTIAVSISRDGGMTWGVPVSHCTGDIGSGISAGVGKRIVWNAKAEWDGQWSEQMRVGLAASDPEEAPAGEQFSWLSSGTNTGTDPDSSEDYSLTVDGLYMERTEVSKALWDTVRAWGTDHGYTDLPLAAGKAADHPVHSVTWHDAVKWCNARSEMEGRTPAYHTTAAMNTVYRAGNLDLEDDCVLWEANGYRLPTYSEWQYAARGGLSSRRFPWGDTITHAHANYRANSISFPYDVNPDPNTVYHPDYDDGGYPYTCPVGTFPPNSYGLSEMAGNVSEWTWNWRSGDEGSRRIVAAGNWAIFASASRINSSQGIAPTVDASTRGFRTCGSGPALTASASFSLDTRERYSLAYTADPNGTLTGATHQTVPEGEAGTLVTAVPNRGYRFSQWTDGRTENPRIDVNVMADVMVQAKFEAVPHDADQNGDWKIQISPELTRLIQFHNSGGYHVEGGTEDGFAPGPGDTSCKPHDADQNGDWKIQISPELTRLIQFYNSGGYHVEGGTEDGYAPGEAPAP